MVHPRLVVRCENKTKAVRRLTTHNTRTTTKPNQTKPNFTTKMMKICQSPTLEDQVRQQVQKTTMVAEPVSGEKDRWTLDADKEDVRQAIGVAFAGTETVGGEPIMDWGLNHCDMSIDERQQLCRFVMSFALFEDLRNSSFQLCSETADGKINSFASVQEYDADEVSKRSMQKLRYGWNCFAIIVRLMIVLKEKIPALFKSKERKVENERFLSKLGDFEERSSKLHAEFGPKGQHWYVHLVGVNPALQGQGKGGELMSKLNEMADKSDRIMHLEAGERNRKFYEKVGYQVQHTEVLVDPEDADNSYQMHLMVREPKVV
jgi:ribosomal protein S18 acetylase RimI-like enzyme